MLTITLTEAAELGGEIAYRREPTQAATVARLRG
jgi:hypothetical protein